MHDHRQPWPVILNTAPLSTVPAFEAAARIAENTEAERKAIDIRVRAERRAGELLGAMQRKPGERTDKPPASVAGGSEYRSAIEATGIKERTAQRWQELAKVPKEQFEAVMTGDDKPSTAAIVGSVKSSPSMSEEALWVWGRLRDILHSV